MDTRHRNIASMLLCAAVLLLASGAAHSLGPQKLNYQVMLTDDADQPLANQMVEMVFSIWDEGVSVLPLWTETQNVTTNSIGVVSVILGSVNPIDIDFDVPLWLEVEVDGEVLSPRREIVGAPYALTDEAGGTGDGHSLDADDGSPVDALYVDGDGNVGVGTTSPEQQLHATSSLQVGSDGDDGYVRVHSGDAGGGGLYLTGDGDGGGRLEVYTPTRGQTVALGPTGWPSGGSYLWLARNNTGVAGFSLVGNNDNSNEPWMGIQGSTQSVTFDMSVPGDDAVMLPESSIASAEIRDESGVASHTNAAGTYLTGYYQNLALECLHAPADGYVLAIGTCKVHVVHDGVTTTKATIGISDSSFTLPANQQLGVTVSGSLNAGTYDQTVTVHGLFAVNGGQTKCAYIVGRQDSGNYSINVSEYQLTLLFVPTAYGDIDPTAGPGDRR